MDTPALLKPNEDEPDGTAQHARERQMIDAARDQIEAGLFIEEAEVEAWVASIGTDHELPLPQPRR